MAARNNPKVIPAHKDSCHPWRVLPKPGIQVVEEATVLLLARAGQAPGDENWIMENVSAKGFSDVFCIVELIVATLWLPFLQEGPAWLHNTINGAKLTY